MVFGLYIVPVIGVGTKPDPKRPKYFADGSVTGPWSGMDYGFEPWMVVGASLSVADNAFIVAQADVLVIPVNLDAALTAGNVTTVQNKLEAINVPAGWVSTALTWRQVVRIVLGMFGFMQRFAGIHGAGRLFGGAVTMETTLGSLSQAVRDELTATAASLKISTAGMSGSTTIRTMLKSLADQMQGRAFVIGGVFI